MKPVQYHDKNPILDSKLYKEIDSKEVESFFEVQTKWDVTTKNYIRIKLSPETSVSGYVKMKNDKSTVEFKIDIFKENFSKVNDSFIIIDLIDITMIDLQFFSLKKSIAEKILLFFKKNGVLLVCFIIVCIGIYMNYQKIIKNSVKIMNNSGKIMNNSANITNNSKNLIKSPHK